MTCEQLNAKLIQLQTVGLGVRPTMDAVITDGNPSEYAVTHHGITVNVTADGHVYSRTPEGVDFASRVRQMLA